RPRPSASAPATTRPSSHPPGAWHPRSTGKITQFDGSCRPQEHRRRSEAGAAAVPRPAVVDEAPLVAVGADGDVLASQQVVRKTQRGFAGFAEYAELVVVEVQAGGGQVLLQL